jgi:hypothetical protein
MQKNKADLTWRDENGDVLLVELIDGPEITAMLTTRLQVRAFPNNLVDDIQGGVDNKLIKVRSIFLGGQQRTTFRPGGNSAS